MNNDRVIGTIVYAEGELYFESVLEDGIIELVPVIRFECDATRARRYIEQLVEIKDISKFSSNLHIIKDNDPPTDPDDPGPLGAAQATH